MGDKWKRTLSFSLSFMLLAGNVITPMAGNNSVIGPDKACKKQILSNIQNILWTTKDGGIDFGSIKAQKNYGKWEAIKGNGTSLKGQNEANSQSASRVRIEGDCVIKELARNVKTGTLKNVNNFGIKKGDNARLEYNSKNSVDGDKAVQNTKQTVGDQTFGGEVNKYYTIGETYPSKNNGDPNNSNVPEGYTRYVTEVKMCNNDVKEYTKNHKTTRLGEAGQKIAETNAFKEMSKPRPGESKAQYRQRFSDEVARAARNGEFGAYISGNTLADVLQVYGKQMDALLDKLYKNGGAANTPELYEKVKWMNIRTEVLFEIPCDNIEIDPKDRIPKIPEEGRPHDDPPPKIPPNAPPEEPCGPAPPPMSPGTARCPNTESTVEYDFLKNIYYPEEWDMSDPLYINHTACPDEDNPGWRFWDVPPFNVQMGKTNRGDMYLQYMDGRDKGGTGSGGIRETGFSTYFETKDNMGYPGSVAGAHNGQDGVTVAKWLDTKDSSGFVHSGLPTYQYWNYRYEDINFGNPGGPGCGNNYYDGYTSECKQMTKLIFGWYKKIPKETRNPNSDGTWEQHPELWVPSADVDVSESKQVQSDLGRRIFMPEGGPDSPLGKFKNKWINQYNGFEANGDPIWSQGENISRRCQQSFKALVKYARNVYQQKKYERKKYTTRVYRTEVWDKECYGWGRWRRCRDVFIGCRSNTVLYVWDCRFVYDCGSAPLIGDNWRPGELAAKGCKLSGSKAPIYSPARSWNYRKNLMTEYKGYIKPDPGFNPDPRNPGRVKRNPGGKEENPDGNNLIPYVGRGIKRPGSGGISNISNPAFKKIKSGYGVTYDAGVKIFSDWGRGNQKPRVAVVTRKIERDINGPDSKAYTQLIRPAKTKNIPVGMKNSTAADMNIVNAMAKKIKSETQDNIIVGQSTGIYGTGPSKSSAPDGALYIRDEAVRTVPSPGTSDYVPTNPEITDTRGSRPENVEGGEYKWKQKSGLGINYGTDIGYFHANRLTKLNKNLVPGLDKSRQHFIHVDYPNDEYSIGSMVEIQFFNSGVKSSYQDYKGATTSYGTPTLRTKMGNFASIKVKGNMYEDSYSAPDNPYLSGSRAK